jgi:hypothetical protein
MKRVTFLALLLGVTLCRAATTDSFDSTFAVTALFDGSVVHLRWAPNSLIGWRCVFQHGVLVFRHDANQQNQVALNDGSPVMPWDSAAWSAAAANNPAMAQAWAVLRESQHNSSPKSEYSAADVETNRMTMLLLLAEFNPSIARALGLAFADSTISKSASYRYSIAVPFPAAKDTFVCETFVETNMQQDVPPVIGLTAEGLDKVVKLSWLLLPGHSGYHVERSEDGTTWARLTPRPYVSLLDRESVISYSDSVENFKKYYYRVQALDAFGRTSNDAVPVSGMATDMTPPQPPLLTACQRTGRGAQLEWQNPSLEPDLAGYGILRSNSPEDGYVPVNRELVSRYLTTFEDSLAESGTYFYSIVAMDTSGNVSTMSAKQMIVVPDTISPDAPTSLVALADSAGAVKLTWSRAQDHDVAGYRIYKSMGDAWENEWTPIFAGAIVDTFAFDSLKRGVRDEFRYAARAQDTQGNLSPFSESVQVTQPDHVPPSVPVLRNMSVSDGGVSFDIVSPSRDVRSYEVTRLLRHDKNMGMKVFETETSVFSDSTLAPGEWYDYSFVSIDYAGNRSPSSRSIPVRVTKPEDSIVPAAPMVQVENAQEKDVRISWRPPGPNWAVIVYRGVGSKEPVQISASLRATSFHDRVRVAGEYAYAIRLVHPDGTISQMSPSTNIRLD